MLFRCVVCLLRSRFELEWQKAFSDEYAKQVEAEYGTCMTCGARQSGYWSKQEYKPISIENDADEQGGPRAGRVGWEPLQERVHCSSGGQQLLFLAETQAILASLDGSLSVVPEGRGWTGVLAFDPKEELLLLKDSSRGNSEGFAVWSWSTRSLVGWGPSPIRRLLAGGFVTGDRSLCLVYTKTADPSQAGLLHVEEKEWRSDARTREGITPIVSSRERLLLTGMRISRAILDVERNYLVALSAADKAVMVWKVLPTMAPVLSSRLDLPQYCPRELLLLPDGSIAVVVWDPKLKRHGIVRLQEERLHTLEPFRPIGVDAFPDSGVLYSVFVLPETNELLWGGERPYVLDLWTLETKVSLEESCGLQKGTKPGLYPHPNGHLALSLQQSGLNHREYRLETFQRSR